MIPMRMSEDEVILVALFFHQFVAKLSNTGSGIDDDDVIAFCPDLKAGGIAAIF